jgi:putative transposase
VVLWRLRYRRTLQDLTEMFLQRGIVFSHETVHECEAKLTPILTHEVRQRCRGRAHAGRQSLHVDETFLLSEHRDMAAAKACFRSAKSATGLVPDRVTTDGWLAHYPSVVVHDRENCCS